MGLFDRFRRGAGRPRAATGDDEAHLREWTSSHRGVEAFVEPATAVTGYTMLLVAADGEWTRRRIGDPGRARKLARALRIPVYDAQIVGYPQRMRDHDARRRILRDRERRAADGGPAA